MIYVYVLTNLINGKYYIGFSKHPCSRFKDHCRSKYLIGQAIRKYGRTNFSIGIINETFKTKKEAGDRETELIAQFNSRTPTGYNITKGGEGNDSETATNIMKNLSLKGKHPWQQPRSKERLEFQSLISTKNNLKRVEAGTHPWSGEKGSKLMTKHNLERVENGTNPWAGEQGSQLQKKLFVEGKSPFSKFEHQSNAGKHGAQKRWSNTSSEERKQKNEHIKLYWAKRRYVEGRDLHEGDEEIIASLKSKNET